MAVAAAPDLSSLAALSRGSLQESPAPLGSSARGFLPFSRTSLALGATSRGKGASDAPSSRGTAVRAVRAAWGEGEREGGRRLEFPSKELALPRHPTASSPVQPRAARPKAPPVSPVVFTPLGPTDLMSSFLRNRIVFVGSTINAQTAQRVISQLLSLAAIDEDEPIKMYINCPGGSTYSVLAIYDCMAWIKPEVSTVGFGMCASQGAFLLSAGAKGKRMAMPNTRIMIHQPQGGCGGTAEDVRRQVNEVMASRDKLDKMFSAFTGQTLETIQKFTERDRFFSAAEAVEFGLIDGILETEY